MTSKGSVHRAVDPGSPPALTRPEAAELAALREAAERDLPVDTSEIAPLDDAFWRAARRNPFFRPVKQQVTVRLDADVLAWLRAAGPGYQTRLNEVLRDAMLRDGGSQGR
ncbi:MAG: BrnA antitoxin family protein [Acetobacteraceae bacterium]|nr:BrnA antitoxin family protein [Acetobacteraceae bacterium]